MMDKIVDLFAVVSDDDAKENFGIGYAKACLEENNITTKLHIVLERQHLKLTDYFNSRIPVLVGLSTLPHVHQEVMKLAKRIKESYPSTHIVLAGPALVRNGNTLLEENKYIDSIIQGEIEATMVDLAERVTNGRELKECSGITYRREGNVIINPPRDFTEDIDSFPFPARDIFEKYPTEFIPILGARGCTGNCTFCVEPLLRREIYKSVRIRSAQNIVEELKLLQKKYKKNKFHFCDPTFEDPGIAGYQRALDLYQEIINNNLNLRLLIYTRTDIVLDKFTTSYIQLAKQAGLESVFLGIESGNNSDLKLYGKGTGVEDNYKAIQLLKKNNIYPAYGFICFNPYSTYDKLYENVEFLQNSGLIYDITELKKELVLYPFTPLAKKVERDGLLINDKTEYDDSIHYRYADKHIGSLYQMLQSIKTDIVTMRMTVDIEMDRIWMLRTHAYTGSMDVLYNELRDLSRQRQDYTYEFFRTCLYLSNKRDVNLEYHILHNEFDRFNKEIQLRYLKFKKEKLKTELSRV